VGTLNQQKRTRQEITEQAKYKKRIKELEKEIRRKDKALAEAAALFVLQKKAREIWGDKEDDD